MARLELVQAIQQELLDSPLPEEVTLAEASVPDIWVWKVGQDYQVVLNDEGIPRLPR
jgi:DNA-directed RNA polymerase specialized sigma54-like protein